MRRQLESAAELQRSIRHAMIQRSTCPPRGDDAMSIDGGRRIDDREPRQARSQHHRASDTQRNLERGEEAGSCMFPHLKLLSGHILFSLLSVSAQRKRRGHGGNNYRGFKRTFHLAGSSSFVIFWGVGRFVLRSFVGGNASVAAGR